MEYFTTHGNAHTDITKWMEISNVFLKTQISQIVLVQSMGSIHL
jgi:hypothetical protein